MKLVQYLLEPVAGSPILPDIPTLHLIKNVSLSVNKVLSFTRKQNIFGHILIKFQHTEVGILQGFLFVCYFFFVLVATTGRRFGDMLIKMKPIFEMYYSGQACKPFLNN